jgi:hypothetical protein
VVDLLRFSRFGSDADVRTGLGLRAGRRRRWRRYKTRFI